MTCTLCIKIKVFGDTMHHSPSGHCTDSLFIILSLPNVLQNELYCVWLGLADLGRLDSAICNKTHRKSLLNAWNDDHCVLNFKDDIVVSEPFAAWVGNRRIKIRSPVAIPEFVPETEACKVFFEATGNSLTKIKYPAMFQFEVMDSVESVHSMQSLIQRVSSCANLKALIITRLDMRYVSLRSLLSNCTKLSSLKLGFAHCIDFRELNECGQYLEEVDVVAFGGKIAPEHPDKSDFAVMKKTNTLRKLQLLYNAFDCDCDRLVYYICNNVGLRELRVDRIQTNHVFWILESCTELLALRVVSRGDDDMEDEDMARLIDLMPNLRYLHLLEPAFTDAWLFQLLQKCAQLQQLYLFEFQECPAIVPKDIYSNLAPSIDPLLSVLHVDNIRADTLSEILRTYPNLTNVGIGHSTIESLNAALRVLSDYKVTELYLSVPRDYTYNNIHLLHDLISLSLYDCNDFTDEHLLIIARNNPCLSALRMNQAILVTSNAVIELVKACQKLTSLRMYNDQVFDEVYGLNETLQQLCPSLVTVEVYLESNYD